ncbi:hypothetical protein Hanom_Chr12g01079081 [Helianthus anomalus]
MTLFFAGSKLATKPKHQGVKWLFLKVWGKTVKVIKPQGAKRKFTLFFISLLVVITSVGTVTSRTNTERIHTIHDIIASTFSIKFC